VAELAVALAPFAPKRTRALVERIVRVIQAAGMSASAIALPPSSDVSRPPPEMQTLAALGRTTIGGTRGKQLAIVVGAALGMAVLGGVIALAFIAKRPPPPVNATVSNNAAAAVTAAATEPPPAPPPVAALPPPAPPPASAPAPAASAAPAARAPAARPAGGKAPAPAPVPVKKDTAAKTAGKKPNCDPNFYLDAQGEKHFKPECF
jgi:hypothetical protein